MNNKPLSEQAILITGASAGIGAALARTLASQFPGVRLVLAARDREKLEGVATICRANGAVVLVVPCDVADDRQVKELATKAVEHFGGVDALVNNAGYGQMGPVELVPPEAAKKQFAVNFHGALILTQALIPVMRDRGGGRIINISSLAGRMAFPVGGLYSASKFALEALSDALRMELKAFNIHVSVIEPGPVKTEFFEIAGNKARESIPDVENTIYKAAFEKVKHMEEQTSSILWSAERVAKVIVRALSDRNPRPRYVAATGGNILLFVMTKLLPTGIRDAFWKRFYGIDKVEKEWKKSH
jgi:short-subunit dehydrogenase